MADREEKIQQLKDYFTKRDDVVMAFLFGSQAKGEGATHAHSDWDIAVYLTPVIGRIEWEETDREYPTEDQMWADVCDVLETDDVDLLILNRAPSSIAATAIEYGLPLIIKNYQLLYRFVRIVSAMAEEYRRTNREFYEIAERSQSLTPRDCEDLRNTIEFLNTQLALYSIYRQFTEEEFDEEPRKRNEIERWLENIINAIIDISKITLGSKKTLIPQTYRYMVTQAARSFKVPEDFVGQFDKWVRLRNVLAHEYLDIKWKRLHDFAHTSEPSVRQFIEAAKTLLVE